MIDRILRVAGSAALALGLAGSVAGQGTPVSLDVDCNAGQTIADALQKTADASPVVLDISGVCRESVTIRRDDVGLNGRPGAAISADATQQYALAVEGGRRVWLSGLTLTGGYDSALLVVHGELSAGGVTIAEGATGARLLRGADVTLYDCRVVDNRFEGIFALDSSLSLQDCGLSKNRTYGIWAQHAHAALHNVDVEGSLVGVAADALSLISTAGQFVRVHDNQLGVRLKLNSVGWHAGAPPTVFRNGIDFSIDPSSIW